MIVSGFLRSCANLDVNSPTVENFSAEIIFSDNLISPVTSWQIETYFDIFPDLKKGIMVVFIQ